MKRIIKSHSLNIRCIFMSLAAVFIWAAQSQFGFAQDGSTITAHQFAENVKNNLIAVIKDKEKYEQEGGAEKYYSAVEGVLDPVVDFRRIAFAVMGDYRKKASKEQFEKFAEVFKKGLVVTYANGMAGFVDYEINVVSPKGGDDGEKATVGLEVKGGDSVYKLAFSLRKNSDSEWRLYNMILDGVNYGSLMQKQFDQAMKKSKNDIDAVISGWTDV